MARIYADADVSSRVVHLLRETGHDVLSSDETHMRLASDSEQLLKAAELQRVLITHNLIDFRILNIAWQLWAAAWNVSPQPEHPGILAFLQKPLMSDEEAAQEIDLLASSDSQLINTLYRWGRRDGWRRQE